ncbi:MAG: PAS domain-containing protein [Candidatus Omnitrophica bacterium]|nr:PAS domain-containing protein [Candidatus Omnitrophota bacterium]
MEDRDKGREELLSELTLLRKRVLEQGILLANNEKYRQIVDNANSIILVMDEKGNITFFNKYAQRFFGFYEKDILGKNVIGTIVSKNDLTGKNLIDMIDDIIRNPERHSVNENENIRSNGGCVRVLWTNKAIINDEGIIDEILCIGNKATGVL